jgi:hypothetical protein
MQVQGDPLAAPQAGMANAPGVFESMNDEDAQMYAGMGVLGEERTAAEAMRDTADAEGQYINQGRTFVAANPLEHLVVGLKRRKGKKDVQGIGEKQTKGRRSLIDLLRRREDEIDPNTIVDSMVMEIDEDERYV